MNITDVSKTAIITLRSRVIEAQKGRMNFSDSMAIHILEKLKMIYPSYKDELAFTKKLSLTLTSHLALRARKYDALINEYITENPGCTVVNLGCGFDSRYWRINHENCRYIELDLPEVIEIKKDVLKESLNYELIDASVLDTSWIKQITQEGNAKVLLVAEGLFMYLNKKDVIDLFKTFSEKLNNSQIILEVVTEKYTHGIWKKMAEMKMKKNLGLEAGTSYNFGIKNATEIESYATGIKIKDEWSFVEEPETPKIYKYLGISRTQWTVIATIN
jgi:methyltransferase (TIGR00027 family)